MASVINRIYHLLSALKKPTIYLLLRGSPCQGICSLLNLSLSGSIEWPIPTGSLLLWHLLTSITTCSLRFSICICIFTLSLIPPAAPKHGDWTCKPQGSGREAASYCLHVANFSLHSLFLTSYVFGDQTFTCPAQSYGGNTASAPMALYLCHTNPDKA